ncbi:PAS domain-containing hybrid sensor histidine kinase/response regulator [Limnospira fusiformis]|uniref:PAS domain-containing hybrid sensor histidine kinase/response regulator n=1 Tax=Limnospira fusiformis TaxID=54297 RepID=UPI001448B6F6|nr:response regulator [Limnospira fusiformis SAG 85.79]
MLDHNIHLSHSHALLKWLNNFAEQGIFTTNNKLEFLSWNHWLEIHSGRSAQDLIGCHLFSLYPDMKERGIHRFYEQALQGQVAFLSQRLHSYLINIPANIGSHSLSPMQQSVRIAPLIEAGEICGTITVIADVTERVIRETELQQKITKLEQTEARLSSIQIQLEHLLASSPAIIYTCYPTDDYPPKFISDNLITQLGYQPSEWINTLNFWSDRIHPDDRPKIHHRCSQILKLNHLTTEYRFRHKNGSYRWLRDEMKLVCDASGHIEEIVGVLSDITETKRLEIQLLRAQRLESIGTLASGIAHDLNNILTPILASVQMFQLGLDQEKQNKMLKLIENNTKRGAHLIKQVLSFAKGFEGKLEIFQVRHLISEVADIARETFPKSINVSTNVSKELWTVYGDPTQLHQILMNLCVNARDAMPGGGNLSLSASNVILNQKEARLNLDAREGCYVMITVSDTGTGITQEVLDRIFEPFFTTKEFAKGSGLGLSTVLGIVKGHNGFIDVDTQMGCGTTFRVYIPASEDTETTVYEHLELITGQGQLILVVDDEEPIREITKASLESFQYQVLVASNGVEAIKIYRQYLEQIDCVVIDIMMPVMAGKTTIRELKSLNPQIKIVGISGYFSVDIAKDIAELGVDIFLAKPFTTQELLEVLQKCLNSSPPKP